jgi:two-component system, cell cycle response regulator
MRILIAENDPGTRHVLESNLSQWGYEVVVCSDGAQAWQALQEEDPPKLAILEWSLPLMDGLEICRQLRDVVHCPYVYIILLTDNQAKGEMLNGLEAGADEYLVKPVDPRELRVRVGTGSRIVSLQDTFMSVLRLSEFEAAHDPLTGLWNRSAIVELVRKELARSKRDHASFSLIAAGLDQFPGIQSRYGRLTSDSILREIVLRIHSTVRSYDSVGRVADEDFIILAPGCDREAATRLVKRLGVCIGNCKAGIGGEVIPLSMSAAVVSVGERTDLNSESLVEEVKEALGKAKQKGPRSLELVERNE